jgi:hypothetical protein
MFPFLSKKGDEIKGEDKIQLIFNSEEMAEFNNINVLPLIYDEKKKRCNIMVFDFEMAKNSTVKIIIEKAGSGRKHPTYKFYDKDDDYICEVRYGDASANALQRGLWTNTKNATKYFTSATGGWIDYSDNLLLVELFSHALVSTQKGHEFALLKLKEDIDSQKTSSDLGK